MPTKILLVEDNPDHALLTRKVLETASNDYEIDSVSEPGEALTKITNEYYDLVLSDYRLPGESALDLLKDIKGKNKDIPFVVVTSAGSEKIAVELMREGAYDYIVKDALYEEVLPLVVERSIARHSEKKKKEEAEEALRKSQEELKEAYAKLKDAQQQLIQAEKMEAVGTMASGVAHEVKNPLGIIMQGINYLEHKLEGKEKDMTEIFDTIKRNIKRADSIIRGLVDFTRVTKLKMEPHDINGVLKSSLLLVEHKFKLSDVRILYEKSKDLPKVMVDVGKMEQVFVNIFLNALQAMPKGGKLFIRAYATELKQLGNGIGRRGSDRFRIGEKALVIEIEDTGTGIAEHNKNKIFDPFFTTKGPRGGAGLGLAVTKSIVETHSGIIDIHSEEDKGTKVSITLKAL